MTDTSTLREANNEVNIEGLLIKKDFKELNNIGVRNDEAINLRLTVETGENEQHVVEFFATKHKKDGGENAIYKSLQTVVNEYQTVADVGREEADKVRINQARIGLNEYYNQSGQLVSRPQINAMFINRVDDPEQYEPKAEFEVEVFVKDIKEEIDKDGEETGRIEIHTFIPLYGGRVIPFTFIADDEVQEGAVEYAENELEPGSTVEISGDIINFAEKIVKKKERKFGKDKEEVKWNTRREYVITAGEESLEEDDEGAFDPEAIKKALTEREIWLEELKNRQGGSKSKKEKKKGFGSKKNSEKKRKISEDDLPF